MHTIPAKFHQLYLRDHVHPLMGKCNAAACMLGSKVYDPGKLQFVTFAGACVDIPTRMYGGELRFEDCADEDVPRAEFGPLLNPTAPETKPETRLPRAKKAIKPIVEDTADGGIDNS